jgi:hypothetical protein
MYEYEIRNKNNNEHDFIWGYSMADAWRRNPSYNREDWDIIFSEYID